VKRLLRKKRCVREWDCKMAQFRTDTSEFLPGNKTIYEVVMVAGQAGPSTYVNAGNLNTSSDSFGRMRVSQPLTLFDSSHRYADNGLFAEDTTGTASSTFNGDEGLVELDVGSSSGDEILRESNKTFSYQPGKSLLILSSFLFATSKTNLRQRVGYFGSENGIFLEQDDSDVSVVLRSKVTGSVVDTKIAKANWNVDPLDGTGPSGVTLDLTKVQLMWFDFEWLGAGSVRFGFVINGQFIVCHVLHHANEIDSTYTTTASLPLRQEITNTGATSGASKAKQICSSVIAEGGYELRGRQHAVGTPITDAYDLTTAGTYYPVVSIRLKSGREDAIVILTALSLLGVGNGVNFSWRVVAGGTVTTASWTSAGADSSVEYTISGTAHDGGGRVLAQGYLNSSNQGSPTMNILKEALFKFQLERDSFAGVREPLSFLIAPATDAEDVFASLDWEEVTR
jgi:hypothetical protein